MKEIGKRIISHDDLRNMKILKRNMTTKVPIVLTKENIVYKIESTHIMSRFKEYLELFKEINEFSDCVFPEEILYFNSIECGYTTKYLNEHKTINRRLIKSSLSLEWKKAIIYKIINLIKKLHSYDIVHNDLQCSNILNNGIDIKLIDFDQLKIKGTLSDSMFKRWLKAEIEHLNWVILSILYDKNLSYISSEQQSVLINELKLNNEFKEYLNNCLSFNEEEVNEDLYLYVNSVTKKDIIEGKNLVKSLNL